MHLEFAYIHVHKIILLIIPNIFILLLLLLIHLKVFYKRKKNDEHIPWIYFIQLYYIYEYTIILAVNIRCTILLPLFFSEIRGFIVKN